MIKCIIYLLLISQFAFGEIKSAFCLRVFQGCSPQSVCVMLQCYQTNHVLAKRKKRRKEKIHPLLVSHSEYLVTNKITDVHTML